MNESKQDGHNILGYRKALLEGGDGVIYEMKCE